jgi:hypothetical protein
LAKKVQPIIPAAEGCEYFALQLFLFFGSIVKYFATVREKFLFQEMAEVMKPSIPAWRPF